MMKRGTAHPVMFFFKKWKLGRRDDGARWSNKKSREIGVFLGKDNLIHQLIPPPRASLWPYMGYLGHWRTCIFLGIRIGTRRKNDLEATLRQPDFYASANARTATVKENSCDVISTHWERASMLKLQFSGFCCWVSFTWRNQLNIN